MTTAEWAVANKVKTGLGIIVALAAIVILPTSFVAWAGELAHSAAVEAEARMQGREEVIHSVQAATHNYDFYSLRASQAEADLIIMEQDVEEGNKPTPTEERKMRRLEQQMNEFMGEADKALEQLQSVAIQEHDHETE